MKRLLILALFAVPSAAPYKPAKYCTPTQGAATWCGLQPGNGNGYTCLHWHPDEEFCMDENSPLPSCCRATEKDSGMAGCACCSSVHGSKRIDVGKVGSYIHHREPVEVEYAQ
jgi:hypothetical protein